jgi:hypothetical protein
MVKRWINNCRTRFKRLVALGVSPVNATPVAGSRRGPWALSNMEPVKVAMPNRFFAERGILELLGQYEALRTATRTAVYGPVCTVVWEGEGCETFPCPDSPHPFSLRLLSSRSFPI